MIHYVIADDHQMFRDGVKAILSEEDGFVCAGEASNGQELLDLLKRKNADIVLLDVSMPQMDGIEALKAIHKQLPGQKVIMLSMHSSEKYLIPLIEGGISGYVLKNTGKAELTEALRTVQKGGKYFTKEIAQMVLEGLPAERNRQSIDSTLSKREKQILKLIIDGMTTPDIAEHLHLSAHTVNTHRRNLLHKLNVRNSAALVKEAIEQGYGA